MASEVNAQAITQSIRESARQLLQDGQVDVVIGYCQGWTDSVTTPCFVTETSEVDKLLFNETCYYNLAKYLVGREGYLTSRFRAPEDKLRVALVAPPATLRTIVGLIQEHQFAREDIVLLGIVDGVEAGLEPDIVVGEIVEDRDQQIRVAAEIERLESMSAAERWDYWEEQFAKCIRCYACRQVCPFCYCERCIAEENQPQWINRSPNAPNNRSWNIIRAFHLVGRCTDCGECDRVCPMDIPLSALNRKMAAEVEEAFGYVTGMDVNAAPALITFQADDPEEFIR